MFAYVIPNQGIVSSPELIAELKLQVRKNIGAFAVPNDILITPALPKTRSGKIMRRILRKVCVFWLFIYGQFIKTVFLTNMVRFTSFVTMFYYFIICCRSRVMNWTVSEMFQLWLIQPLLVILFEISLRCKPIRKSNLRNMLLIMPYSCTVPDNLKFCGIINKHNIAHIPLSCQT